MQPCCENLENREEQRDPNRPGVVISVCSKCGRRHIELTVDPGVVGVKGVGL